MHADEAKASTPPDAPYRNPDRPIAERVDDLVARMTLAEKVSQMLHEAPAIERLGVPTYNWWNECLHGVARAGTATVFPQAIGLAATWNTESWHTGACSMTSSPVGVGVIGCGSMAHYHIRGMLQQLDTTQIVALCDPSPKAYAAAAALFTGGLEPPPYVPTLEQLLADYSGRLDAALIISPHIYHHDQAVMCLQAGLDVLLEKPMVVSASEARSLIEVCEDTGRIIVVAFNGSLSPNIRRAAALLRSGELGDILNINAVIWQNWADFSDGTWRQKSEIAGGGFMFDTGAHMLNTVADLAGEDFAEVAAWFDNRGRGVEILGVVIGRLRSGALVTLNGCGDTIPSCASDVRIFCDNGIIHTGVWGEYLEIQRSGESALTPVATSPSLGPWQQFLAVRDGRLANPCPPEAGLRMARLYDAIKASAAQNGRPVEV